MNKEDTLIVGCVSDDPFAIDVAHFFGQKEEISDIIALKQFANSEFCPRFISDEEDFENVGSVLESKNVVIVSTCCGQDTRNALAMRTCITARAAKDNGAGQVILAEPDLFFSAQDRGPKAEHGEVDRERDLDDRKKFDGQPFTSRLYCELLQTSGVDTVITVHNHSVTVARQFSRAFKGRFHNLSPAKLYADYLVNHEMEDQDQPGSNFVLCAPDSGAVRFVTEVKADLESLLARSGKDSSVPLLLMDKARIGERQVAIHKSPQSPTALEEIAGKDLIVLDDMVRTGYTIMECCRLLKNQRARRVIFMVTHFYSSNEVKENLGTSAIDQIVTTNTLPAVLNRDMQGRLRKKMLVLKIEKWIAGFLQSKFCGRSLAPDDPPYSVDVSSKNPRWSPNAIR